MTLHHHGQTGREREVGEELGRVEGGHQVVTRPCQTGGELCRRTHPDPFLATPEDALSAEVAKEPGVTIDAMRGQGIEAGAQYRLDAADRQKLVDEQDFHRSTLMSARFSATRCSPRSIASSIASAR